MYAAVRMSTLCFFAVSSTSLNDLTITSSRRSLIVAPRPKGVWRSCTHSVRVESLRVCDRAARVREADDHRAELGHELRGEAASVAEALDHHARAFEVHVEMLGGLDDRVDRAARRRLVTAFASADGE